VQLLREQLKGNTAGAQQDLSCYRDSAAEDPGKDCRARMSRECLTLFQLSLCHRLHEVIHIEKKLYLVFEFVELDLKKVMDSNPCFSADQQLIKVCGLRLVRHLILHTLAY
jgi:hypothetical protein